MPISNLKNQGGLPIDEHVYALFESLLFLAQKVPASGAWNMALDEALLGVAGEPLLRFYGWEQPTVSIGYFEKHKPVRMLYPGWDLVRRWTGGGVVEHGKDFTYSLVVPAGHEFLKLGTADSYERIHGYVMEVLMGFGYGTHAADGKSPKRSQACFENPARFDVLVEGRKVAGAAQRRSRKGLLHQGSIQLDAIPMGMGEALAACLSPRIVEFTIEESLLKQADRLAQEKYGSPNWTTKF